VELRGAFDTALEGRALSTLALVRYTESDPPVLMFDATLLPPSSDRRHRDVFEIQASDGRLIARSKRMERSFSERSRIRGSYADFFRDGAPYRAILMRNVPVLDVEEGVQGGPEKVTVIYASSVIDIRHRLLMLGGYIGG